jgi:hypothetical protein
LRKAFLGPTKIHLSHVIDDQRERHER